MKGKNQLYIIILILCIASICFRLILGYNFEQYSILFVGVPALIAVIAVRFTKTPKTARGMVFYTITIFLLLAAVLFGEGTICIIMAAPLFYGLASLILWIKEYSRNNNSKLYSYAIIPLIVLLMEPLSYLNKPEIKSINTSIHTEKQMSLNKLNSNPDMKKQLPSFLKMGFPEPTYVKGDFSKIGDTKTIGFTSNTKGLGELTLKVIEKQENKIKFNVISDKSHINHWLEWQNFEVKVNENGSSKEIIWTTNFTCSLSPRWYFEPIEEYAVKKMNEHLLNTYFN